MAQQQVTHIKVPVPPKLNNKETQQNLRLFKMQFRQYMKQDDHYRAFLSSDVEWDPNADNYGFEDEEAGLRRTAAAMKDDCKDFIFILATFLPHDYLTEKLVSTSTSFESAFKIIEEHFGLSRSQESYLELESFTKQGGESHRQFYERLLSHTRDHLVDGRWNVSG